MKQDSRAATPPTVMSNGVAPLVDAAVSCQWYGHCWHSTHHPDVKHCSLCGVRGYCPGCTPIPPAGAKPFDCTAHARERQVQP